VLEVGGKWLAGEDETPGVRGREGDISVYDGEGRIRVHINGRDGSIRFHDTGTEDTQRIRISGEDGAIKVWDTALAVEFDFDIEATPIPEPGMVMVLVGRGEPKVRPCESGHDHKVVGVLMEPRGIILRHNPSSTNRGPIAVAGRVDCWVQDDREDIGLGDLLATHKTLAGTAQKLGPRDPGLRVGKALKAVPKNSDPQKIPILLTL